MATVVLAAAGNAVGGAIGGSILGIGAATLGQAAGAIGGALIDQTLLGRGSRAVEVGRASSLRLQRSTEGAPVPVVYGRMRVSGTLIWSTRFHEAVNETRQGGKGGGGQTVREYSYSISIAVALCEGVIDRVGRIWADGQLLDTGGLTYRVYRGDDTQAPDPKIEAVEGAGQAPAYRGTAYVVFEDLPVGPYGNRIPQLSFEVFRPAAGDVPGLDESVTGTPLPGLIKAVALSPGTGEFSLHGEVHRYVGAGGSTQAANVSNPSLRPDIEVALDQLEAELPGVEAVSLIVSWFGDDLRCGRCRVEPRVEEAGRSSSPNAWTASGLTTATATPVSRDANGAVNYGGSPSDASIISAIQALKARGYRVLMYPFLLMDVVPGNAMLDPYTGAVGQPVFPWRGRITLDAAPGETGTTDQTAGAAVEVGAFFGTASAADFDTSGSLPDYTGPTGDWGWRRFVLHLAALAKIAGGVEAFAVGTEFRGLTQIRSDRTTYPAVAEFRALAAEVRALLPDAALTYAADWSEYFGHRPDDGTGDHLFHLDPLWADPEIGFVGIDDYMSCSDWRHREGHADAAAGARSVYALDYLDANVEGGENFDWYYASQADRDAQVRTPIIDGAHGEDWLFRPKDLAGWWSNAHHDRVGGVRSATPTAWVPGMKPIRLTETGCPAVDLGANQPNVFIDPKSSESAVPYHSRGARDDEMQRRYLQAKLMHWRDHGGAMLSDADIYVWTWDARPWPDFPNRTSTWADGPNHRRGHWITGRVTGSGLAEVVAAICARSDVTAVDVGGLHGAVQGYLIDRNLSAREALQPLMTVYGFDAFQSGGTLRFRTRGDGADAALVVEKLVEGNEPGEAVELERGSRGETGETVRLGYFDAEADYEAAAVEAALPGARGTGVDETSVTLALSRSQAQSVVERWLVESDGAQDSASLSVPPSALAVEPGDVLTLQDVAGRWRVDRVVRGLGQALSLTRIEAGRYLPRATSELGVASPVVTLAGPIVPVVADLPIVQGAGDTGLRVALGAAPWPGGVDLWRVGVEGGLASVLTQQVAPTVGWLATALAPGVAGYWQRVSVEVELNREALSSAGRLAVLDGANALAV
ncbi:MAG: glycoside hydrolase/phage tail family protein, partial [Pseudomonadota bacterium]